MIYELFSSGGDGQRNVQFCSGKHRIGNKMSNLSLKTSKLELLGAKLLARARKTKTASFADRFRFGQSGLQVQNG